MEIWNDVCREVKEFKNPRITENKVQEFWMSTFLELGWSKFRDELVAQFEIPIGSSNKLRPDILLRMKDRNLIVIELKRHTHDTIIRNSEQLVSYMLQLKLKVGILIGSDIQLYYDDPNDGKSPAKLLSIDFVSDNPKGIEFFELLNRSSFSEEKLLQYCQHTLDDQKELQQAENIAREISNDSDEIKDVIRDYFMNKYSQRVSERVMKLINLRIEKILGDKTTSGSTLQYNYVEKTSPLIDLNVDEKIGQKAKRMFSQSITNERFTIDELNALCDSRYSKSKFGSNYPILKEIAIDSSDDIRFDNHGRSRYWKEVFYGYGKRYYITSQWYSNQAYLLESYFKNQNSNKEFYNEKSEFSLDGVTYKIILNPDETSKYPHLINTSTGYIAKNQKGVCRDFLKPYGFDVPMDAEIFLTHDSIKLVYKIINRLPLTQKELSIKV